MGIRTGKPRGRPKGAQNKRTKERQEALARQAEKVIAELGNDVFEGDAHAFLMLVYKDKNVPLKDRIACAIAAAPYEKPRLAAVEVQADLDAKVEVRKLELVAPMMLLPAENDDDATNRAAS